MDLDTICQKLLPKVVLKEPHPNQLVGSSQYGRGFVIAAEAKQSGEAVASPEYAGEAILVNKEITFNPIIDDDLLTHGTIAPSLMISW